MSKKRYPKHISKFLDVLGMTITPSVYKQLVYSLVDTKNHQTFNPILESLYLKGLFVVGGVPSQFYGQNPNFYVVTESKLRQIQKKYGNQLEGSDT